MDKILSSCKLFHGIKEAQIPLLLECLSTTTKQFKKGEFILKEGVPTKHIGIVLSGQAMICCSDVWGNQNILDTAMPSDVFAEAYACIPNEPLHIFVTAAVDTKVLLINVEKIISSCNGSCEFHARLVQNLLSLCAYKSLQLSSRILHTSPKSIRKRLLSYFSECSKKTGTLSFTIPYSRQQLADYLSVDRSAMSAELSKMQADGLIIYHKNHFELNKPE